MKMVGGVAHLGSSIGAAPSCSRGTPAEFARSGAGQAALTAEEIRKRAREWVNRTVPMQTVEDEEDNDCAVASKERNGGGEVWDSDEEGVETCMRVEAQPEAGAGGPSGGVPFFMQVLNKQWGG